VGSFYSKFNKNVIFLVLETYDGCHRRCLKLSKGATKSELDTDFSVKRKRNKNLVLQTSKSQSSSKSKLVPNSPDSEIDESSYDEEAEKSSDDASNEEAVIPPQSSLFLGIIDFICTLV
jgi:hypothetical protein